jgi:hypothetical protein
VGRENLLFPGPTNPEEIAKKLHSLTITDFEDYKALFSNVTMEKAVGDASVRYLYFPQASEQIYRTLPDSKIIIILRNPVDRLYSHFLMMKSMYSLEPLTVAEAIEQENDRMAAGWDWDWHYVHVSLYFEQVERYIRLFGSSNVRVFIYEDFCERPLEVLREIFQYLGVEDDFLPDMSGRGMQTYWPNFATPDWLLRSPNWISSSLRELLPNKTYKSIIRYGMRLNRGTPPPLPDSVREQLKVTFHTDITKLENLLGRKLPW